MHVLPVGRDHDQHHDRDQDGDLPGVAVRDQPGEGQGQQDLVGRVGDRGQRVRGEHRQRDPFGQQGLAQLGAAELAADEEPLGDLGRRSRASTLSLWRRACRTPSTSPARLSPVHIVIMGCGRVGLHPGPESGEARPHGGRHRPGRRARSGGWVPTSTGRRSRASASTARCWSRPASRRPTAFAAVSSGDNSNILSARVVRETFDVHNVVARIYDPGRAEVYERLGIPTVATVRWTADQVLRRLLPAGSEPQWRDPSGSVRLMEVHVDRVLGRPHGRADRGGAPAPGCRSCSGSAPGSCPSAAPSSRTAT